MPTLPTPTMDPWPEPLRMVKTLTPGGMVKLSKHDCWVVGDFLCFPAWIFIVSMLLFTTHMSKNEQHSDVVLERGNFDLHLGFPVRGSLG